VNLAVSDDGHNVHLRFTTSGSGSVVVSFDGLGTKGHVINSLDALGKVLKLSFV